MYDEVCMLNHYKQQACLCSVQLASVASDGLATGAAEADIDAAKERLEVELDNMRASKELFLGRFEVRLSLCVQTLWIVSTDIVDICNALCSSILSVLT
jgi:hypothetical protein